MKRSTARRICELARERGITPEMGADILGKGEDKRYNYYVVLEFENKHLEYVNDSTLVSELHWLEKPTL